MLAQEVERAGPSHLGRRFGETWPLVAMKAVRRVWIGVDLAFLTILIDRGDIRHRDALVLLAKMHLHRNLRLLVGEFGDLYTVIGDRGRDTFEQCYVQKCVDSVYVICGV